MKFKNILYATILLSATLNVAEAQPVTKIVLLTKSSLTGQQLTKSQDIASGIGADFNYFVIDDAKNIISDIEKRVPKSVLDLPKEQLDSYLQDNVVPVFNAKTIDIMRSKFGLGMAKMYHIEYVPAFIINDKYVYYGDDINDALTSVREHK